MSDAFDAMPEKPVFDRMEVLRAMEAELKPLFEKIIESKKVGSVGSLQDIEDLRASIEVEMKAAVQQAHPEYEPVGVVADVAFSRREPTKLAMEFCALTKSDKEEMLSRGRNRIPSLLFSWMENIDRSKIPMTSIEDVAESLQTDVNQFVGSKNTHNFKLAEEILSHEIAGRVFNGPIQNVVLSGSSGGYLGDGTYTDFAITLRNQLRPLSDEGYRDPRYRVTFSVDVRSKDGRTA